MLQLRHDSCAHYNSCVHFCRGLDNAGKSTFVARFFGADLDDVPPTVGFEIQTFSIGELNVDFWDVGGQSTLRQFWHNYFNKADGLLWVVDSADVHRLHLCREQLHSILKEEVISRRENSDHGCSAARQI